MGPTCEHKSSLCNSRNLVVLPCLSKKLNCNLLDDSSCQFVVASRTSFIPDIYLFAAFSSDDEWWTQTGLDSKYIIRCTHEVIALYRVTGQNGNNLLLT